MLNNDLKKNIEYPGGFDCNEIRELLEGLVSSHISKAMSGEKMKTADRDQDLAIIREHIVSAAHLVRSLIEEREGVYESGLGQPSESKGVDRG